MVASRGAEVPVPTDDAAIGKSELPSQPRTGEVTVSELTSPSAPPDSFKPGWRFYASFVSLCIINLAVALDATSLSIALPVTAPLFFYEVPANILRISWSVWYSLLRPMTRRENK